MWTKFCWLRNGSRKETSWVSIHIFQFLDDSESFPYCCMCPCKINLSLDLPLLVNWSYQLLTENTELLWLIRQIYIVIYNTVVLSVSELVTVTEFHINFTTYFYYDKTEEKNILSIKNWKDEFIFPILFQFFVWFYEQTDYIRICCNDHFFNF
jgi:hypothetical protein